MVCKENDFVTLIFILALILININGKYVLMPFNDSGRNKQTNEKKKKNKKRNENPGIVFFFIQILIHMMHLIRIRPTY